MNIMEILRNPIVKTVGIAAILYFALFYNKENPESLGNRLSPKNIKEGLGEVTKKAQFIAGGISTANEQAKEMEKLRSKKFQDAASDYKDIKTGEGEAISCGDYALISYKIFNSQNQELAKQPSRPISIGTQQNLLLERNIIGMKRGGTRVITVTQNPNITDPMLKSQIEQSGGRMIFEVTLENFDALPNNKNSSCK
jgi:hypothetical protein